MSLNTSVFAIIRRHGDHDRGGSICFIINDLCSLFFIINALIILFKMIYIMGKFSVELESIL